MAKSAAHDHLSNGAKTALFSILALLSFEISLLSVLVIDTDAMMDGLDLDAVGGGIIDLDIRCKGIEDADFNPEGVKAAIKKILGLEPKKKHEDKRRKDRDDHEKKDQTDSQHRTRGRSRSRDDRSGSSERDSRPARRAASPWPSWHPDGEPKPKSGARVVLRREHAAVSSSGAPEAEVVPSEPRVPSDFISDLIEQWLDNQDLFMKTYRIVPGRIHVLHGGIACVGWMSPDCVLRNQNG